MHPLTPFGVNPAIAGEIEFFEDIEKFRSCFLEEFQESEFTRRRVFPLPDSLIADGTGLYCRFNSQFAVGELEGYRPFPGVSAYRAQLQPTNPDAMSEVASNAEPDLGYIVLRLFHSPGIRYQFGSISVDSGEAAGVVSYMPEQGDYGYSMRGDSKIDLTLLNFLEQGEIEVWHRLGIPPVPLFQRLREGRTTEERTFVLPKTQLLENIAYSFANLPRSGFSRIMTMRLKIGELLCLLGDSSQSLPGDSTREVPVCEVRRLAQARSIITERYASPPSIAELSRMVGLNRKKLTEGFKRMFGDTVGGYSLELRMRHACDMLKLGDGSITDIALACGYEHASNFTLAFRRRFGTSPSQFRAQHRVSAGVAAEEQ
ncbi:MAG: AraC family transcriptional regulator [Pseudomonadota bacterium]